MEPGRNLSDAAVHREAAALAAGGYYQAATRMLMDLLERQRRELAPIHPSIGRTTAELALLNFAQGNVTDAKRLTEDAVHVLSSALGRSNPTLAHRVREFAEASERAGDPQFADELRQSISGRNTNAPTVPGTSVPSDALLGFGKNLANRARFEEAEEHFRAAIGLLRNSPASRSDLAEALSELGEVLRRTARFAEAEPIEAEAYAIVESEMVPDPTRARVLSNFGLLMSKTGNFGTALRLIQRAIDLYQAHSPNSAPHGIAVFNLAALYEATADVATAERLYLVAADILAQSVGVNDILFSLVATNLGNLYRQTDRLEASESLLRRAVEVRRHYAGEQHPWLAASLINLGCTYCAMGRLDDAATAVNEAIRIEEARPRPGLDLGFACQARAIVHSLKHEWQLAIDLMERAIKLQEAALGPCSQVLAGMLANLAFFRAAAGEPRTALTLMERVTAMENFILESATAILSDHDRAGLLVQLSTNLAQVLAIVVRDFADSPEDVATAFRHLLIRKAVSAEVMAMQREAVVGNTEDVPAGTDPYRKPLVKSPFGQASPNAPMDRQVPFEGRQDGQDVYTPPQLQLSNRLKDVDVKKIAAALPPHSILVEFIKLRPISFQSLALPEADYYAFVLRSGEPDSLRLLRFGPILEIDKLVMRVRGLITTSARSLFARFKRPTFHKEGHELSRILLDPLRSFLGAGQRIFISPDGELNMLPFEVLPFDKKQLLVDVAEISYLASGRDLLRFRQPRPPSDPSVVVADPNFDLARSDQSGKPDPDAERFGRLPGTRDEGKRVAELLGVKPWLGDEALKSFLLAISSPQILHIATHGFFHEDPVEEEPSDTGQLDLQKLVAHLTSSALTSNPLLRSGLALASANCKFAGSIPPEAAGDGLLTAHDVASMNLAGTQLVVLSACVTGLGEIHPSEGTLGLRRSFIVAGAKGLIVSLWSVPDRATAKLMVDLYGSLRHQLKPTAALRSAQARARRWTPNPYFWSAFVFYGDDL